MLGAILGDICGAPWENGSCRNDTFKLFAPGSGYTDDTVCTVAIADALIHNRPVDEALRDWCQRYPGLGYGGMFTKWVYSPSMGPYDSWGNGGAMRAAPCGWLASELTEAERLAELTARPTHDSPEGLRGARAIAGTIWMSLNGNSAALLSLVRNRYGYPIGQSIMDWAAREPGGSDAIDTVPIALDCGLQASSVEDAIRRAAYIGGDVDTIASMAAAIAEARFGLPTDLVLRTRRELPADMLAVVDAFLAKVGAEARCRQRVVQPGRAETPANRTMADWLVSLMRRYRP